MGFATRRQFLHGSLAAGTALAVGAGSAPAIEPIRRAGKSHLKLSIAAYSFNRHLNLKGKSKPTMNLDDFIDFAVAQNLEAVELTAYYFPRTTPDYLAHLKGKCTRLGLDVSGTAVGNNFCVKDPDKLKKQVEGQLPAEDAEPAAYPLFLTIEDGDGRSPADDRLAQCRADRACRGQRHANSYRRGLQCRSG